jgi:hypothetical protein
MLKNISIYMRGLAVTMPHQKAPLCVQQIGQSIANLANAYATIENANRSQATEIETEIKIALKDIETQIEGLLNRFAEPENSLAMQQLTQSIASLANAYATLKNTGKLNSYGTGPFDNNHYSWPL